MTVVTAHITGPRQIEPLGPLDQRTTAWRDDLADIALAGLVAVPHYVTPLMMAAQRATPVLAVDKDDAVAVSELLPGEAFALLDSSHGYGWGYCVHDGYVGHVALDALARPADPAGWMVAPGDALIFTAADIKAPVAATLPAGAHIAGSVAADSAGFIATTQGFIHQRHLLPAGTATTDWVEAARSFIGAPYRWGGRSRAGIDCSGLVQMARMLAGHNCRRDSDMQAADATAISARQAGRGDIASWPGHIGILTSADTLLHANAHWMRCVEEPLADASARIGSAPQFGRL